MSKRLDAFANVALGVAALVAASTLAFRTFVGQPARLGPSTESRELSKAEWQRVLEVAQLADTGSTDAVRVVEFVDVECPFCARYHDTLVELERSLGSSVVVATAHFPLSQHKFARSGALALECSAEHGLKKAFLASVFAQQDSIGLKAWSGFAAAAGVVDLTRFQGCVDSNRHEAIVSRGYAVGLEIGVAATPTLVVEGLLVGVPPSAERLAALVEERRHVRRASLGL
jgi:protein-disulfide isomerase